jgi:myo-inositol 2-dehydrogenase / D-chiro-inositol 1-dehydrogenase
MLTASMRAPADDLRVGVIGVGRIGVMHARTLATLPGVASVTLADADATRARQVAAETGTASTTVDGLFDAKPDAVLIATATPGHGPLLRRAAEARVSAFCEKPVALDLATLDDAIDATDRAGILVQVGFQRRFDAGYRAARAAVATGKVGNVLVVRAATHDPTPPAEAYIAGSGGIFRDLHIHDFDAIRYVTGQEIVEVYADGAVRETPWFERHGDVDTAVAVLRLSGGTLAILTGARHDPRGYDVRLEVFGTADSIGVGLDERTALRSVEPGEAQPARPGHPDFISRFEAAFRAELIAFLAAVRAGERTSACPPTEARAALLAALAADRSRAERRPVTVAEIAGD